MLQSLILAVENQNWLAALLVGCLLTGCLIVPIKLPPHPSQTSQAPDTAIQSQTTAQMETQVHQQVNKIRQARGLESLQANEALAKVARTYSQKMAQKDFFSHVDPEGTDPAERVSAGGLSYQIVAENLFMSTNASNPAPLAVESWMGSPGHRQNLLRSGVTETGVGVWRDGPTYYITQLFLWPR